MDRSDAYLLCTRSDKMGFFDDVGSAFATPFKAVAEAPKTVGKGIGRAVHYTGAFLTDPIGTIKDENPYEGDVKPQDDEYEEDLEDVDDELRRQRLAASVAEPGYGDPGMAPEDGEAFDAEAWREAQIQRANDFVELNTKAMDTRDRIMLRPIQTRNTLRYGGTSSVPDALPLQLVHSTNVV